MRGDLNSLAVNLDKLAARIPVAANETKQNVASVIVGDLAFVTPVDTSQALSNWQANNGAAADGAIPPHFPGVKGSTQHSSAVRTLEEAKTEINQSKPGQPVHITNNVPYIRRLNDGYSSQAPAGFVERSILLARKAAQKFKL